MRRQFHFIIMLSIILILFVSCIDKEIEISEYNTFENNTSENNTSDNNGRPTKFEYKLKKDVVFSTDVLECYKIDFPKEINDLKASFIDFYTDKIFFVLLYEEISYSPVIKEYGLYNLENNSYKTLFEVDLDSNLGTLAINEKYIILRNLNSDNTVDFKVYDFDKNTIRTIYKHEKDYFENTFLKNDIILYKNKLYFDDIVSLDNEISISLFTYDLDSNELEMIKEKSQNPMMYQDEILVVSKSNEGEYKGKYKDVCYLDNRILIKLTDRLREISSSENGIYALNNKFTDNVKKHTIFNIVNMINDEELLETVITIDDLKSNSNFVTWRNFIQEKPIIYSKKLDKFILFDQIEKGCNTFYIYSNRGIILNDNEEGVKDYYYFIYKE